MSKSRFERGVESSQKLDPDTSLHLSRIFQVQSNHFSPGESIGLCKAAGMTHNLFSFQEWILNLSKIVYFNIMFAVSCKIRLFQFHLFLYHRIVDKCCSYFSSMSENSSFSIRVLYYSIKFVTYIL